MANIAIASDCWRIVLGNHPFKLQPKNNELMPKKQLLILFPCHYLMHANHFSLHPLLIPANNAYDCLKASQAPTSAFMLHKYNIKLTELRVLYKGGRLSKSVKRQLILFEKTANGQFTA